MPGVQRPHDGALAMVALKFAAQKLGLNTHIYCRGCNRRIMFNPKGAPPRVRGPWERRPPAREVALLLFSFSKVTMVKTTTGAVVHDCAILKQWVCPDCHIIVADSMSLPIEPPLCPRCLEPAQQRRV